MTTNHEEPTSGLDRDNNQRADVNQEAKEASSDGSSVARGGDAAQERMDELTQAAAADES